jgi:hypothetical protein
VAEQVFDTLLEGIVHALRQVKRAEWSQLQPELLDRYFDFDAAKNHYIPKVAKIRLPKTAGIKGAVEVDENKDGTIDYVELEVPLIALVPVRTIIVDKMHVKFKIRFTGAKEDKDRKGRVRQFLTVDQGGGIFSKFRNRGNLAEVEVYFKGLAAPEGWARVMAQFEKLLP